ncbi:unnamed protein product [Chrysoparadoxa australica]
MEVAELSEEAAATPGGGVGFRHAPQASMTDDMRSLFHKLIDSEGNLDMRNVTTVIWVNRDNPCTGCDYGAAHC